jgi:hypothetical protein
LASASISTPSEAQEGGAATTGTGGGLKAHGKAWGLMFWDGMSFPFLLESGPLLGSSASASAFASLTRRFISHGLDTYPLIPSHPIPSHLISSPPLSLRVLPLEHMLTPRQANISPQLPRSPSPRPRSAKP